MKYIILTILLFICAIGYTQPANDNCANAIVLTVDNPLLCGQNSTNATLQAGECFVNILGATESSMWYRFNATNDSIVLDFIQTNITTVSPVIMVAGPYAPGTGCMPACAVPPFYDFSLGTYQGTTGVGYLFSNGDYGNHMLLTGLVVGQDYLIRIQNENSAPNRWVRFCIGVQNPASNVTFDSASSIDACGTSFSGTTSSGHWPVGASLGFNSFDSNATTTCPGATEPGDDVPFIVNNNSWFTFCAVNAGTWQVTIDGIGGCALPLALGRGIQAAILTGTSVNMTNIYAFPNPMAVGGTYTSSVFAIGAGECAYVVVDGFSGDACNYSVTLTNVTGGCVLPIELTSFNIQCNSGERQGTFITASEYNTSHFIVQSSDDMMFWDNIQVLPAVHNSNTQRIYNWVDNIDYGSQHTIYYQLVEYDTDGAMTLHGVYSSTCNFTTDIISIQPNPSKHNSDIFIVGSVNSVKVYNLLGEEVRFEFIDSNVIRGLASGVYIFMVNGIYSFKIIVGL